MEPADVLKVLAQALAPYLADVLGKNEASADWETHAKLETKGDLADMRFSEVRLRQV